MEKLVNDLSLAIAVLEVVQEEPNVSDPLCRLAEAARIRLEALGKLYLEPLVTAPAA